MEADALEKLKRRNRNALKINKHGMTNETWQNLKSASRNTTTIYGLRNAVCTQLGAATVNHPTIEDYAKQRNLTPKTMKADDWFDLLYAIRWCASWGRTLSEWTGLVAKKNPPTENLLEQNMIEDKLDELIAAIKENTAVLKAAPQTAAPAKAEPKKAAAKKTTAKAKAEEPADDATVSKTDVKNKLLDVQEKLGADTAKDILRNHAKDGKAVFSALPQDAYAAVIADCDAALKKAA